MADNDAELSERQEMEVEALAAIYESGEKFAAWNLYAQLY